MTVTRDVLTGLLVSIYSLTSHLLEYLLYLGLDRRPRLVEGLLPVKLLELADLALCPARDV